MSVNADYRVSICPCCGWRFVSGVEEDEAEEIRKCTICGKCEYCCKGHKGEK